MIKTLFPNQNGELFTHEGDTVADACSQFGLPLDMVCGGRGICKKFQVETEKRGLRQTVLACQEKVSANMKVYLNEKDNIQKTKVNKAHIMTNSLLSELSLDSAIKKIFLSKSVLQTPFYQGDWEHIQSLLLRQNLRWRELRFGLGCVEPMGR